MSVEFRLNGKDFSVSTSSIPIETSLNTFIRNHAHLSGTKFMCLEGGCGACIVNVSGPHPVSGEIVSHAVNSCLFPIFACHGLDIVTVEGIGDERTDYHATQKVLAHFNGTQCGYCSPGMVMNMYSLLQSKKGMVSMAEVENAFGGNICRCTGYRPILDAFKSLACDADPKLKQACFDIEDLGEAYSKNNNKCAGKCPVDEKVHDRKCIQLSFPGNKEWYKVYSVSDVFKIFEKIGSKPYMLIGGNTAHGVYRRSDNLQIFIDVFSIGELRSHKLESNLIVGANVTLTEFISILSDASSKNPSFNYCSELMHHIDLIANVPVRNTGTIAGNLSIKHEHNDFPSDLYLILETVGATMRIMECNGNIICVKPSEFVCMDLNKKLILSVILPPLEPKRHVFKSFKIMPRAQNAHAYVNGAFLLKFREDRTVVDAAAVCYGGINPACLFPVFSCHGLDIVTVEGIGDKHDGYHATQKVLAHFNGTQCGYCSPGMVMNMYSLLESNKGQVSMAEVENAFGGNMCRCTGYRPILDAFKSLAYDAEPRLKEICMDIEDLSKMCPKTGSPCSGKCSAAGKVSDRKGVHMTFAEDKEWHKVYNVSDVFAIFEKIGSKPYMLVAGNTAHGVYRRCDKLQVFVDVSSIEELRSNSLGNNLIIGANVSLTELMSILTNAASKNSSFGYCNELVKHIDLIANVPVRNTGTIAGNLSIKNQHKEFPSDLYLILKAVGATLTIMESGGKTSVVTPSQFVNLDMKKKLVLNIIVPPLDPKFYVFRSFKIMPRAQNAHAYVNAAFLLKFNENKTKVEAASICFGGINPSFTHATSTENYLVGKNLFENAVVQEALKTLSNELQPDWVLPDASPEYRRNLAISLFYKFILNIATDGTETPIKPSFKSGGTVLERPVSTASQRFDTIKENYPLTKNIPKIEGLAQTSGEAKYANDLPALPNELYAAYVLGTEPHAQILNIDASEALKIPGVVAFFSAKDIPGVNNFMYFAGFMGDEVEPIFSAGKVEYHGQPIGMVVAETFALVNRAVKAVKVTYSKPEKKDIYPTVQDVLKAKANERIKEMGYSTHGDNYDKASEGDLKVKGHFEIGGQYHYYMETQTCVCIPIEDGMDVYSSTQWVDLTQMAIARMLKVPQNSLNLYVRRLGGGYGGKGTRATMVACACALAAHLTKRPVRLVMTLEANMEAIGKRYPVVSDYEVDVDKNGKIVKLYNEYVHDFGSTFNESMGHAGEFFSNCYDKSVFKTVAKGVRTDCASNTWCRAPGTTEGIAMIETIMEHIAFATGKDPLEVRLANMPEGIKMIELMPEFRADVEYDTRMKQIEQFNEENRWRKRGIAIVPMRYPLGYFGSLSAIVTIYHDDGTVAVSHGGIEMGQGMNTKVAQVVAHILNIPMDKVIVKPTNNLTAPNAICTGGSMTTETVSYAAKRACEIILERMKPVREENKDDSWETLVEKCHHKSVDLSATYMYKASDLTPYIIWGLSCSEVEVDILTGNVQLRRVDILEDVGESLSPGIDVGQIEGAFIMGLGYYLTEALVFDPENGALLTNRTWTYKPPGAKDIPVDFRVRFLQNSTNATGVLRSKATGEPAMNMTISIIFALRRALLAARKDAGLPSEWVSVGAPSTPDQIYKLAGNSVEHFTLN